MSLSINSIDYSAVTSYLSGVKVRTSKNNPQDYRYVAIVGKEFTPDDLCNLQGNLPKQIENQSTSTFSAGAVNLKDFQNNYSAVYGILGTSQSTDIFGKTIFSIYNRIDSVTGPVQPSDKSGPQTLSGIIDEDMDAIFSKGGVKSAYAVLFDVTDADSGGSPVVSVQGTVSCTSGFLKEVGKKLGPLPVWAWVLIATGLLLFLIIIIIIIAKHH